MTFQAPLDKSARILTCNPSREQLIHEIEQAPEDLVQTVLDFLHRAKATPKPHLLAKFAGILSDAEAEEIKQAIKTEFRQVDPNEW